MKYEEKAVQPKANIWPIIRTILFLLFCASIIYCICEYNNKPVKLKDGQMFLLKYGSQDITFIVKKHVEGGFIVTSDKWLWSENLYINYGDLNWGTHFKPLGMYEKYGKKTDEYGDIIPAAKPIDSTLAKLPIGAKFKMVWALGLHTFIVVDKSKNSILVRDPGLSTEEWSLDIPFENFNPKYYKRLR